MDNGSYNDPGGNTYSITNQTGANFSVTHMDTVIDNGDTIILTETCLGTLSPDGSMK